MTLPESDRDGSRTVRLRKYPNRRFYDAAQSQHVTLEDILQMIRDGHTVVVTDSKTGEDITAKVLTQIILEHDAPKLDVFSAELLHQVIRANEPLVREFVDKYFNQAFLAFSQSQQQFSQFLRETLGLDEEITPAAAWSRMMLGPFAESFLSTQRPADDHGARRQPSNDELRGQIEQLSQQIASLQKQLDER